MNGWRATLEATGKKSLLLVLLALPGVGHGEVEAQPNGKVVGLFYFAPKPGPFPVGLQVVEQYDYSRGFQPRTGELGEPYPSEPARPLQTLIWYPAQQQASMSPMSVGQYVGLGLTETTFGRSQRRVGGGEWWFKGWGASVSQHLRAVRDAERAGGSFPLVIYAPSFSAWSWENADLCEYLASYGYIVIASPGMGVTRESTHDVSGASAQAQDI